MSKKSKEKNRVYISSWEKEPWAQGWLMKSSNDDASKQAFCKVCNKDYRAHHGDLQKHADTEFHKKNLGRLNNQKKISTMCNLRSSTEEKERDLKLATYIACHSSIQSSDHLCEILNDLNFKNLKLHRTKCTKLIQYVIAPSMLNELVSDIGNMPYSFIVDESTDVSSSKYLCICVKYFSQSKNRMLTDFLGLIEIEKADAISLHTALNEFVKEIKLPICNLIGLGTDGGSNLCGKNHSLFTLLKSEVPNLQLVKCICHALNLAASAAADEFPASVEFLCREIYNWFKNSAVRRSQYRILWDILNKSNENSSGDKNFHQFVQLSATRWLARYNVVKVLVEHYEELKTHFNIVVSKEKCFIARCLNDMLNDEANYLYLKIVLPILYEINDVNISFQKTNVNVGSAYDDLSNLILLLSRKIVKPNFSNDLESIFRISESDSAYLPIQECDFGIEYSLALRDSSLSITQDAKNNIEFRAFAYIKKVLQQLLSRLPDNLKYFRKLQSLSSNIVLNQIRPKFIDLPFLDIFSEKSDFGVLENQYNKLLIVKWIELMNEEKLKDSNAFWAEVFIFKNAGGKFVFRELALFAITILSLPSSNAVVERVFSIMNVVKTKLRNRMLSKLLEAVLRIRMHLNANGICCKQVKVTDLMLENFNSKIMYQNVQCELEEEAEILDMDILKEVELPCINLIE